MRCEEIDTEGLHFLSISILFRQHFTKKIYQGISYRKKFVSLLADYYQNASKGAMRGWRNQVFWPNLPR